MSDLRERIARMRAWQEVEVEGVRASDLEAVLTAAEKRAEWEAEQHDQMSEQWGTIVKLRDQIEEARNAWWSATEQGDNGLIYTDRIEDAMDDIWSAIGHAEWMPVPDTTGDESEGKS